MLRNVELPGVFGECVENYTRYGCCSDGRHKLPQLGIIFVKAHPGIQVFENLMPPGIKLFYDRENMLNCDGKCLRYAQTS